MGAEITHHQGKIVSSSISEAIFRYKGYGKIIREPDSLDSFEALALAIF